MTKRKRTRQSGAEDGRKKVTKVLLICILAVLLAVLMALVCLEFYYHNKVKLLDFDEGTIAESKGFEKNDESVLADDEAMREAAKGLEEMDAVAAEGDVFGDEDVFNVLLIGTDERSDEFSTDARGDACILASVNKETMVVHLVSLERGMGVPILDGEYEGQWDWLTHTFRYGGADLMMREVEECFKVQVDYYVRANFYTFEQLINAVGGVDIELTELEAKALNGEVHTNARAHTRVHAGMNHLDGYDALQYSRERFIDSDWQRIGRQRNVLQTVINQAKTLSLGELDDLLDTVLPLLKTNLTESDITGMLLSLAPKALKVSVEQMTIPAEGTYGSMTGMDGRTLFAVDFDANAKLLRQALYGE